jgi:hypothetical protein
MAQQSLVSLQQDTFDFPELAKHLVRVPIRVSTAAAATRKIAVKSVQSIASVGASRVCDTGLHFAAAAD